MLTVGRILFTSSREETLSDRNDDISILNRIISRTIFALRGNERSVRNYEEVCNLNV